MFVHFQKETFEKVFFYFIIHYLINNNYFFK